MSTPPSARWNDSRLHVALTEPRGAQHRDAVVIHDPASGVTAALHGRVFNEADLATELGCARAAPAGTYLVQGYLRFGLGFLPRLNGHFVLVIGDRRRDRLWIARDPLGIEPLFYHLGEHEIVFGSSLQQVLRVARIEPRLNTSAVLRYCLFNYNFGWDTLVQGVEKLRPAHVLRSEGRALTCDRYWYLSFGNGSRARPWTDYRDELLHLLQDAVRCRLGDGSSRVGIYLSGGMDSSSVVSLMRRESALPIHSFSFRAGSGGYDESRYARLVSQRCRTEHHEMAYDAADASRIADVVDIADEPFSDVGIEIASFLLGHQAAGVVDSVLTGDGGDELFGGHPVYLADRFARPLDRLPAVMRRSLSALLQQLPDGRQKQSLSVKAKRFAYGSQFPSYLHSNRWRIYYTSQELGRLLAPDWRATTQQVNPLAMLHQVYQEADGLDPLSLSLYGDYQTVVDFYLRRMELVRSVGVEPRFPLLDHRLVAFCASLPPELKITRRGETKFILHRVMTGIVPDEIVHRKDKLGHSVPLKNWLRDSPSLQTLIEEYLSPTSIEARGIFDTGFVRELWHRHLERRDNNSHRLWSLLVFELWCRKHIDRRPYSEAAQ